MNISQVSFPYFFNMLTPLVIAPTLIGAVLVWFIQRSVDRDLLDSPTRPRNAPAPRRGFAGRLGLWATGLAAAILGFVACAGWLSWSFAADGSIISPALPAPNQFPTWQIVACGATVIAVTVLMSVASRRLISGACASALGTAAGFTTAFALDAAAMEPSQQAVGVMMSMVGLSVGLGICACGVALIRLAIHRRKNPPPPL